MSINDPLWKNGEVRNLRIGVELHDAATGGADEYFNLTADYFVKPDDDEKTGKSPA